MDDTIHPAPGRKVLIHGGSGGVGSFAIQYARRLGAHIATTVRGERAAFVRQLGADEMVDYTQQRFEAVLHDYDAVLDTVGGDVLERSFQVLKPGGVLVSLVEQPNAALIDRYGVQAQLQGTQVSTVRLEQLADLIDRGVLKVYIDRVLPLDQAQEAFDYQQNGHPQCKVVVTVG
jgi:NADPH:quinone reductase-like Zn-dependent oxidoreductase